jgi:hypothetical protein
MAKNVKFIDNFIDASTPKTEFQSVDPHKNRLNLKYKKDIKNNVISLTVESQLNKNKLESSYDFIAYSKKKFKTKIRSLVKTINYAAGL